MQSLNIRGWTGKRGVIGKVILPGDKSIAHRALILGALSEGKTVVRNFPNNDDCRSTVEVFRKLGVRIVWDLKAKIVTVRGQGLFGLKKPKNPIFIFGSGTTYRLLLGILAGQNFTVKLSADKILSRRPMLRVIGPLRQMGAQITAAIKPPSAQRTAHSAQRNPLTANRAAHTAKEEYPPLLIKGGSLKAITYKIPVASAQVKSAILLAALYVKDETRIIEPLKTRDHTEKMLKLFQANIKIKGSQVWIKGYRELVSPGEIFIPGDVSSASFFIVLALLIPGSRLMIEKVGLNPSRMGIIRVLKRMGADIKLSARSSPVSAEPMGSIMVKSSVLKGTVVKKEEIPFLIDELPILMVAASFARGLSVFQGVEELRVKETDRINSMLTNLRNMGADCRNFSENIIIMGKGHLFGAKVKSFADHRTAMSMIVAALKSCGRTDLDDISCIDKSFPGFLIILKSLFKG